VTLLLDEPPVLVQPSLVRRLGLLEAAIVQQLHYWSARATRSHDGHAYVYKTYQDWSAEIGVSAKQARGALDRLRKDGVAVAIQNPTDPRDRTLWWRIDHAVLESGGPSAPTGRSPSDEEGVPSAPAGSSNAGASEGRTETTSETPKQRAHAKAMQLPDDFPDSLKPHARDVFRVLRSVAEQHGAREVTPRAVGHAIMGEPGRHYVAEAHALAAWAQAPPRPIRDVVGTYRTWLQRAQAYAGIESMGAPVAATAGPNVHHIRPVGETRFDRAQESLRVLHDRLVAEGR
jgi:hypothetical protein